MHLSTCHHPRASTLPSVIPERGTGTLREQATRRTGRRTTRPFSAKKLHPVRSGSGLRWFPRGWGFALLVLLQEEVRLDARDDRSQPAAGHPSRCNARPGWGQVPETTIGRGGVPLLLCCAVEAGTSHHEAPSS